MNTRVWIIATICLRGCTQVPPAATLPTSSAVQQAPLSNYFWFEPMPSQRLFARVCQLGTSCLDLVSRPF